MMFYLVGFINGQLSQRRNPLVELLQDGKGLCAQLWAGFLHYLKPRATLL